MNLHVGLGENSRVPTPEDIPVPQTDDQLPGPTECDAEVPVWFQVVLW